MAPFLVSYDLRRKRNYDELYAAIQSYPKSTRILESDWIISSSKTVGQIRDHLVAHIDADDGLFVAALTGAAAWRRTSCGDEAAKAALS